MAVAGSPAMARPKRPASSPSVRRTAGSAIAVALLLVAEGELQPLDLIVAFLLDRDRVADLDRSERRLPLQGQARGDAHVAQLDVARAAVHVAVVDERRQARARAREQLREEELEGAGDLHRA